jgi:stress response protein YsnF
MAKTIVGIFDEPSEAAAVVQELVQEGISRNHISLITSHGDEDRASFTRDDTTDASATDDGGSNVLTGAGIGAVLGGIGGLLVGLAVLPIPGLGPVIAAGPIATTLAGLGIGAATGGMVGALTNLGVPEEHAQHYAEAVRRGGTLVTVNADDAMASRVQDLMNRHHAVDVNQRAAYWRQGGWTGYDAKAPAYTADQAARERMAYTNRDLNQGQVAIPVIEEQIAVGKREVQSGGVVRVSNRVVERPVEESVRLREERVNVERRAVDRPASAADESAFREGTLEFKETVEEPVVSKTARVVEEVIINKDVEERTEKVQDTVKRTEVEVQQTPRQNPPARGAPPRSR